MSANRQDLLFMEEIISIIPAYLKLCPLKSGEDIQELRDIWHRANQEVQESGFGIGNDTSYDIHEGDMAYTERLIGYEIKSLFEKRDSTDRHGWAAFVGMIRDRIYSCEYRWGTNKVGLEIYREGPDRFIYVRSVTEGFYQTQS